MNENNTARHRRSFETLATVAQMQDYCLNVTASPYLHGPLFT